MDVLRIDLFFQYAIKVFTRVHISITRKMVQSIINHCTVHVTFNLVYIITRKLINKRRFINNQDALVKQQTMNQKNFTRVFNVVKNVSALASP